MEVWGGSQLTSSGVELAGLDVWVYSKPFGEAQRGGDVYYVSSCASGRISRLLLADVSGHGKSVASMAADLRTLMRRFVNRLDQKEFVRLLNEQFTALSSQGSFSTAVVTTFFAPSRRLTLCNAGHPRPLLFRAVDGRWSFLGHQDNPERKGPRNIPLGIFQLADYENLDIELEVGDCLVSYTDALIESCDADGEMLGEEGLLRIVNLLGDIPAEKLIADDSPGNRRAFPRQSFCRRRHPDGRSCERPLPALQSARETGCIRTLPESTPGQRSRPVSRRQPRQHGWGDHSGARPPLARPSNAPRMNCS